MEGHVDCLKFFVVSHTKSANVAEACDVSRWHPVLGVRNDFGHLPVSLAMHYHKSGVVKYIEEVAQTHHGKSLANLLALFSSLLSLLYAVEGL